MCLVFFLDNGCILKVRTIQRVYFLISIIHIFYAGRGGYQKRIDLIVKIAQGLIEFNAPVEFHFAGDYRKELPGTLPPEIIYHGILDREEMNDFITGKDVLLMTSVFEGFPLIIMESMSRGVVPVTTAVDGICDHITSSYNGLLIEENDETRIVEEGARIINRLCRDRTLLMTLSQNAIDYAFENFNAASFTKNYREILLTE